VEVAKFHINQGSLARSTTIHPFVKRYMSTSYHSAVYLFMKSFQIARVALLLLSLATSTLAANVVINNDPSTGEPGKFASAEIERATKSKGMVVGQGT
jgi:hypothetical protein